MIPIFVITPGDILGLIVLIIFIAGLTIYTFRDYNRWKKEQRND